MEARRNHDTDTDTGVPGPETARPDQLRLIHGHLGPAAHKQWVLDRGTRVRGLAGVAQARRVLAEAQPPEHPLRRAS